jgi:hypothetical protein
VIKNSTLNQFNYIKPLLSHDHSGFNYTDLGTLPLLLVIYKRIITVAWPLWLILIHKESLLLHDNCD